MKVFKMEIKGVKKELCYEHVPTLHKECKHYGLQTCTTKKKLRTSQGHVA